MPVPVTLSAGTSNRSIIEIPGIDPRTASFYSPHWSNIVTLAKGNGYVSSNLNDGLVVKENAFGLEGSFKLGNGWTLSENFRK